MRDLHVTEIRCKSILNRSGMGFSDYTLNAYLGCAFGCSYCYVPVIRARRGQADEHAWGRWVQVKINAPDVLRRQMLDIPSEARLMIGTATDSWQPLEKKYRISRHILEELAYYPNHVSILTRSPLLIRDIDILCRMPDVSIGVSLPTFDEGARRVFEPHAPTVAGRVHLVRRLVEAGLRVSLFLCPILYGVADSMEAIQDYLCRAADLSVSRVICGMMNYTQTLAKPHMQLLTLYRQGSDAKLRPSLPRTALSCEIARWSKHYGIPCKL